ncbi:MAG: hypothetical protein Q9166_002366 [cf. Caloplaca sp. 2 TL-2023]
MVDADTESSCQGTVLDLPQLYTRPSPADLLSTLHWLKVKPAAWDDDDEAPLNHEDGLPRYLTSIIASPLVGVEDESVREQIWEAASARLSERSGRSAIPSISRTFVIPATPTESVSITLHEPSLTADNLGHKTWLASYLLSKRLSTFTSHLPPLQVPRDTRAQVIELGAGTGLVGLAIAAMFDVHVHLTDLPDIVPNLRSNATANVRSSTKGSTTVGELDWSTVLTRQKEDLGGYDLVVAADPLYSPEHPAWLAAAIGHVLKRDVIARAVIEFPLREAYTPQTEEFKVEMAHLGLVIQIEGVECGFEDWEGGHRGTERTRVECWWTVWRWGSKIS